MGNPLTRPGVLLRLEGAALLAASVLLYANQGGSWLWFAVFLLAPDLAMVGYLVRPSLGAALYNLVHITVFPLALGLVGFLTGNQLAVWAALVWLSHIGMDRTVGYGLKYTTAFKDTHLQRV
jgi:hypothetical protein